MKRRSTNNSGSPNNTKKLGTFLFDYVRNSTPTIGLRKLKLLGAYGSIAKGDSAVVVSWGKGSSLRSWHLSQLIHEIRKIAVRLEQFVLPCFTK